MYKMLPDDDSVYQFDRTDTCSSSSTTINEKQHQHQYARRPTSSATSAASGTVAAQSLTVNVRVRIGGELGALLRARPELRDYCGSLDECLQVLQKLGLLLLWEWWVRDGGGEGKGLKYICICSEM